MYETSSHIISRFKWDTIFDQKERASELQQRLSKWSRINMQKEVTKVFDAVCPPGQTWRIQSLELNLGIIDFNELEFDLAAKLGRHLHEKLIDLIIYANRTGDHNVKILNKDVSHIEQIRFFLLYGLMPWSYKSVDGSVNQMLTYQLQNNRQALIAILREAGVIHEDVRKRMAWQINEPAMLTIIEGLEPNNYLQVIGFSKKLTAIQQQKNIVQTSISDFKKNLWLWILNYLLNDRGTVFNRIAFMKSSIRQMAQHYNIRYGKLFNLIELSVATLSESLTIKSDFVLTLKALSEENKNSKKNTRIANESRIDLPGTLKNIFRDQSLRQSKSKKIEFNDLVISLSRHDKPGFQKLITDIGKPAGLLQNAIKELNDTSLEAIFFAISPAKSLMLTETIYFLHELSREINLDIDRDVLWKIGLNFLNSHRDSMFDNTAFLKYCIAGLSKQTQTPEIRILEKLINAKSPSLVKTIWNLEIYTNLTSVFVSEISGKSSAFFKDSFKELLDTLGKQLVSRSISKDLFVSLQKLIKKDIQLNPKIALQVLIEYPDKENLREIIPYILNDHISQLLVKHSLKEKASLLFTVQDILSGYGTDRKNNELIELFSENLMSLGLQVIVFNPELRQSEIPRFIFKKLFELIPSFHREQSELLIDKLLKDKKLHSLGIPATITDKIFANLREIEKQPVIERVIQLINTSPDKRAETGKILMVNFPDPVFTGLRKLKTKEGEAILNYLLHEGKQLMDALVREYRTILVDEVKQSPAEEIVLVLNELCWKCMVNFADHNGRIESFKRSFQTAVLSSFPVAYKKIQAGISPDQLRQIKNKKYRLKSGNKVTPDKLYFLIKECFLNDSEMITNKGKAFYFGELVDLGLELEPRDLRRIIATTPPSEKRIKILKTSVSFSRFSSLIMNDEPGVINEAMESLRSLHNLVEQIAPGQTVDELANDFWMQLWMLIKTNTRSEETLKKLVQNSFYSITKNGEINAGQILSEIKKKDIHLTPALRNILTEYIPAFKGLPSNEITKLPDSQLSQLEQKGLLDAFTYYLISQRQIPVWFSCPGDKKIKDWLNEIIRHYPLRFLAVLKREVISESQMSWLNRSLNFEDLVNSISNLHTPQRAVLIILKQFHVSLGNISLKIISPVEIQNTLFRKILKAWMNNNWRIISIENIWNELIWDFCVKRGIHQKEFIPDIQKVKSHFPASLQVSLEFLNGHDNAFTTKANKETIAKPMNQLFQKKNPISMIKGGIPVTNAGLVLVNNYIPVLFERLGITHDKNFADETTQCDAVHYLQYLATGSSNTEESLLALNKVICGLSLSQPVKDGIDISEKQQELIESLLQAVIHHWPSIGNSSINGFRGNWLIRDGLLTEQDDRWELTVERRAYDLLISKSPFSFSVIKHPWMNKPLHVNWTY